MNVDEALNVVDAAVFAKKKRHLKDVERVIFRGAWQRQNYYQIAKASDYTATYLKQDVGPKFWKLLTEVLGEPVSKTNLQAPVEREWHRQQTGERQAVSVSDSNPRVNPTAFNNRNFVGRQKEITDLNTLVSQGAKIILIRGGGGIGKSWLSWEYLTAQRFDLTLELWMAKETQNITIAKSVAEEWLRRHFNEEPRGDFGVTLEQLRQKLRDQSLKVGVLIDNLEPALDKYGKFIPAHRDYVELLRVLADPAGNCVTLITSRERLGESAVTFLDYQLEGLDRSAWEEFFKHRNIKTDSPALSAMHQAYSGNAKAMHIIAGVIQADWSGDMEAYWQVNKKNLLNETDLQDLVVSQLERLQELDSDAYKLLCRLGCYRYQDVRAVLLDAVTCLLWDVPESQRRRVVKSLRDRSLVDFLKGEYWLHPVIRAEARARLKLSEDWKIVNCKAAEFWTKSVETVGTIEDALKALEAYYHYVDIEEFDRACDVLLKERKNSLSYLGQAESLDLALGRLGLVQNIISASKFISNKISNEYHLTRLCGHLGGHYHHIGEIRKALEFYQKSREMAKKCQKTLPESQIDEKVRYYLGMHDIGSLFTIASCKLSLWEIEEAKKAYEELAFLAEGTNLHIYAVFAWFSLALLYSLGESESEKQKASELVEKAYQAYKELPTSVLSPWTHVYGFFGLGEVYNELGENEKAFEMYNRTISYAEETNYGHAKGQALTGLATLYRQQGDFEKALENHAKSIEILEKLAAKTHIATGYYEMGLTYQKMGKIEKSKTNFAAAIRLYEQIEAPRQIERVQKAIAAQE